MNLEKSSQKQYQTLLNKISQRYIKGQTHAVLSINENIINTNWNIVKYIIKYKQVEKQKMQYGAKLFENLSKDLTLRHDKRFSQFNLNYIHLFYLLPICETLSHIRNILYDYFDIYNLKSIFFMYDNGSQQCQ